MYHKSQTMKAFQIKEDCKETWQLNAETNLRLDPVPQNNATKDILKFTEKTSENSIKFIKFTEVLTAGWLWTM